MSLGKVHISLPAGRRKGDEKWALRDAEFLVRGIGGEPRGSLKKWIGPASGIHIDIQLFDDRIRIAIEIYEHHRRPIRSTSRYMDIEVQDENVLLAMIFALSFLSLAWFGGILRISENRINTGQDGFVCSWESLNTWSSSRDLSKFLA